MRISGGHKRMKVVIRPIQIQDVDSVRWYASDELVARTTDIPSPYPPDAAVFFVKDAIEGWKNKKHLIGRRSSPTLFRVDWPDGSTWKASIFLAGGAKFRKGDTKALL